MTKLSTIQAFLAPKEMAVCGVSRDKKKFGRVVYDTLKERGFKLYGVNPNMTDIDGNPCYQDVSQLPEHVKYLYVVTQGKQTEEVVKKAIDKMRELARKDAEPTARVEALEALADSRGCGLPVWVSLGDALLASGRADEASVVWERALRTHPHTVLVGRLASIATEERHRDRLRTLLRKLRSDQVRADMVRLLAAMLHLQDGHTEQAAQELDGLQQPEAAPPYVHRLWAQVHRQRGQLEQALATYAKAPGNAPAYRCAACGRLTPEWTGYCTQCHAWDSYRSEVEIGVL